MTQTTNWKCDLRLVRDYIHMQEGVSIEMAAGALNRIEALLENAESVHQTCQALLKKILVPSEKKS